MESTVLVKAFSLIEALANGAVGLAELASVARVTKPTAHRILQSLVSLGYAESMGDGKYRLTRKLRQLSLGLDERSLVTIVEPSLQALREATGETVNLGVLRANRILYLAVLESSHALRRVGQVNADDPVFTTALGRAIASHLPPEAMERLLRSALPERRTAKTVTSADQIRQFLVEAKKLGYAVERDQTEIGVTCLAAPVFDRGEPVAAISISAPSARVAGSEEKWVRALRRVAAEASKKLEERTRVTA